MALFVSFSANAGPRWFVSVEDDLFSDTGKKATLVSSGNSEKLVFDIIKTELIEMTGISSGTLAKMSKDQEVSMTVLLKICTALNVELSEVAEITE